LLDRHRALSAEPLGDVVRACEDAVLVVEGDVGEVLDEVLGSPRRVIAAVNSSTLIGS